MPAALDKLPRPDFSFLNFAKHAIADGGHTDIIGSSEEFLDVYLVFGPVIFHFDFLANDMFVFKALGPGEGLAMQCYCQGPVVRETRSLPRICPAEATLHCWVPLQSSQMRCEASEAILHFEDEIFDAASKHIINLMTVSMSLS